MNVQKKLILIVAFLPIQISLAQSLLNEKNLIDKALCFVNQSRVMHFFENQMAKLPKLLPYGNELASPEYQELGKEAQIAAGIPEEYHVPIKKIPSTHPLAPFVGAVAEADAIYVNEEKLNQRSYGARRSALFHEAIHKKNNDMSSDTLLELAMMAGLSLGTHACIKAIKPAGKYKILHALAVIVFGMCGGGYASSCYHHYFERRADIEGHYATHCSQCVHESAEQRRIIFEQENSPLKNNGYLCADDLEKIAQELENRKEMCAFHAKHVEDNVLTVVENS